MRVGVLLYGTLAVFTTMSFGDSVIRYLFPAATPWLGLGEGRLLIGIGVLGLAALAVGAAGKQQWARRLPWALSGLAGAVLVVYVMDRLYTSALEASQVAPWAAIVILVAIGWDIAMSGESLTNRSSPLFPRPTRALGYFGYAILLAGTIVYFSGQHSALTNARPSESFFEPEAYTQAALFRVALPLMVLLFLLQVFGAARTPALHESDDLPAP